MNAALCHHDAKWDCVYCKFAKIIPDVKEDAMLWSVWMTFKNNKKSYARSKCKICKGKVEPYMLRFNTWKAANNGRSKGFMCLSCVETSLARKLILSDFTPAPINYGMLLFDCRAFVKYGY